MSKKTLLNESTVRKFMKFANIGALTENFVSETYSMEEEEAEEGMRLEGEHDEGRIDSLDEEDVEDMGDDMPPVDDAPVDDVEVDAGGAELDMSEDEAMALAQGLVDALTDLTGHEFTASSAGGAPDMDMPGDEGPEDADLDMNMGADDKDDDEDEVLEGVHMVDEEEVVSETLRRVTKRIKNMSKRNRMV